MLKNITVEEAWEIFQNIPVSLQPESVSLIDSLHRISSFDIFATGNLPSCSQSAVDGFVLHSKDLQGDRELLVREILGHGTIPTSSLNPGNTVKVVTGGILPAGSAAVIPQEDAILRDNFMSVKEEIAPGTNIKMQGEDFKEGEIILKRNARITPGVLAVLAAFGQETIMVNRRPSVAIICLGPEIIPHYVTPGEGEVRDSNGPLLASLILQEGGQIVALEYVGGACNRDSIINILEVLFEKADLVLTIGGTAFGESSHQALPLLSEAGVKMLYWGIQVTPGSHSGAGLWGYKPVIALSGNSSACAVGYHLLVSPVLRRMQGLPFGLETISAVCVDNYRKKIGNRRFLRGRMFIDNGMWKVKILPGQKSSMLKSLLNYNSLIDLHAGHPPVDENSMVKVLPLYKPY